MPCRLLLPLFLLLSCPALQAQDSPPSRWGPNDTIVVQAIVYNGERMPYRELEMVWISKLPPDELAKVKEKYNRLRNAVFVTYPYARIAGKTLGEIQTKLEGVKGRSARKSVIKSREKELKTQFSDPLTKLSVYQGRILMKLINRQTGNDCYEIIKEYKGGLTARAYQTVAFFFGSSLRQEYAYEEDATDRQIEAIVREIEGAWYQNPARPGTR